MSSSETGTLYIIATPIGNLDDISPRALETLKNVDLIACEDTRHSQRLLSSYSIQKQLISLHQHNERSAAEGLIQKLLAGKNIAVISDAGTPLISDPGATITKLAHEHNIKISPIPGASSVISALSASGLPSNQFIFGGFIPSKDGERMRFLDDYLTETRTAVFFETPHRIGDTIKAFTEKFPPQRKLLIARELTKQFEQIQLITIENAQNWLLEDSNRQRGEFVLVLEGAEKSVLPWEDLALDLVAAGLSAKDASALVAKHCNAPKRDVYQFIISL